MQDYIEATIESLYGTTKNEPFAQEGDIFPKRQGQTEKENESMVRSLVVPLPITP